MAADFRVGWQRAGNINNVTGDQTVHGGRHAVFGLEPATSSPGSGKPSRPPR